MKIYVAHSTSFDFRAELYQPLRAIADEQRTFIFPHEDDTFKHTKQIIADSDLVLAEVSYPSTGQGIELGWAECLGTAIVCIYKAGYKPSSSLNTVSDTFIEYASSDDIARLVRHALGNIGQE